MRRPVDGPVGQGFGENPTNNLPATSWIIKTFGNYQPDGHTGQDYPCDIGTPIRAVTSGTVLHAGWYGGTYLDNGFWIAPSFAGYCYVINHDPAPGFPGGFIGVYAHGMDGGAKVRAGQRVTEGQVIGMSGNTGGSTGPHLHFEILPDKFIVNGYMYGRVNPENLFSAAAIAPQDSTIKPLGELSMADINSITKQLADIQAKLAPINTSAGAVDLRQFIADGTRAAQAAEKQTGPINVSGGQEGIRDFIAKGTRAAQASAAELSALKGIISQLASNQGVEIDYDKIDAIVKANLEAGVTVDVNVNK